MKFDKTYLADFINYVDVHCPQCEKHAVIKRGQEGSAPRFACLECGYMKEWNGRLGVHATGNMRLKNNVVHMYGATDPYFGYSLWYQAACCGHILWAYNRQHLQFYGVYISDKLRERQRDEYGWSNQSLQSRLPKWMLAGKNRDEIRRKIARLKEK